MKILLVSPKPPPVGGIASWTLHILNYFSGFSNDIEIIHLNSSLKRGKIVERGLLERIKDGVVGFWSLYNEYVRLIRDTKPKAVHITSSASFALFKDFFLVKFLRKHSGIKSVLHFRFGRIPEIATKNKWEWKMIKLVIRISDKCIVIDKQSYDTLINRGFNNVFYVPNPLSPKFLSTIENVDEDINREEGILLFVGHIIRAKGVLDLLNAILPLKSVHELRLIGPFSLSMQGQIENILKMHNKQGLVKFLGVRDGDDVVSEMKKCSMLVLPSYTEGFPNVIIEAMAVGCPIVSTNVGAIPDMLNSESENKVGICVNPGHVLELRNAISNLLENRPRALALGSGARKRVEDLYSIDKIGKQLIEIWR